MVSRDPELLYPPLRERFEFMQDWWLKNHPDNPKPFLTCTYRSPDEQLRLVREGKSRAEPMQSLHNYEPAYAFDVAFKKPDGLLDWSFHYFERWGILAESLGLEWGGRWKHLVDGPHVQLEMTWRDAKASRVPQLPPLPETRSQYEVLVIHDEKPNPQVITRTFVASLDGKPLTLEGRKLDVRFIRSSNV